MVIRDNMKTINSLLLLVQVFGVLRISNTIKISANRNPPLPSFQDMVKEAGYEMNTKIMGAVNKIIVMTLEPTNKDPTYMAMVDSDLTFNHFPHFPVNIRSNFSNILIIPELR
jgi:hypothetical protein